jgi:DNA-directed RNA polymerase specialized sigma24 family protein
MKGAGAVQKWEKSEVMNLSRAFHKRLMTFRRKRDKPRVSSSEYATREDFCRIFQEDMKSLYLLAFLLTANHVDAEKCLVAAIEHAFDRGVFEDFARQWSRRVVIRDAIRIVLSRSDEQPDRWVEDEEGSLACMVISAVAQLAPLDRIVFVMSVLERYSELECALLLDCRTQDVQQARICALQQLPFFDSHLSMPLTTLLRHGTTVARIPEGVKP